MVLIRVLASGSQGNAVLVEAGDTRIMIDAGLTPAHVHDRVAQTSGRPLDGVDGIVITHGHCDHAGQAAACSEAFGAPVYMTSSTQRGIRLPQGIRTRIYGESARFSIGAVSIHPLPTPHDAPQVALRLEHDGAAVALATDLGQAPAGLAAHFSGCGVVLLESNHDPVMLEAGPYPPRIQKRVAGPRGHLSNGQAAAFLGQLGPEVETVVLMHLSEKNNRPELARAAAEDALSGRSTRVLVANQTIPLHVEAMPVSGQLGLPLCS